MKTDYRVLKTGDKISMITFMEVTSVGIGNVHVTTEDGEKLSIGNGVFEENIYSTQIDDEQKMSKTAIAELLTTARDAVIQVCFDKADGTERVLTGYVIGSEPLLGRSFVIDLEKPKKLRKNKKDDQHWDERQRQVDHRTLKWLVYKGIKYKVK